MADLSQPNIPREIKYDLRGSPTLDEFFNARGNAIEGLMCPFGSGKTVALLMKSISIAHEMPPCQDGIRRCRYAVVRNTYSQLEDTTMKTFFAWIPPSAWGKFRDAKHSYVVTGFKGVEIEYIFRALDRPDHVQNLLSLELSHALVNEAREVPKEVIGPLYGRTGRFPPRVECGEFYRRMMMDTNPPDTDNWWYTKFEDERPKGWRLFKQPGGLIHRNGIFTPNPLAENLAHLPSDYYDAMVGSMSESEVKVYACAEYGHLQTGKPVYPEYRDSWHCREFDVPKGGAIKRGWDFGLTPAAVFVTVMPNGQVRIFDEQVADRAGIQSFTPIVKTHTAMEYSWATVGRLNDVGDPAGASASDTDEQSCFDIMHALGVDIQPGQQDPTLRQESVRYLLKNAIDGEPMLLIHPRCKRLRKGFQGEYKHRRLMVGGSTARYVEKPDKNMYSHPHDALQYIAVELVGDIVRGFARKPGERVQTHSVADFEPMDGVNTRPDVQHQQAFAEADFDPY